MGKLLNLTTTSLNGLMIVRRERRVDHRGSFQRVFCAEELREAGWLSPIAQINVAHTSLRGTVRGMHFQNKPYAEMKLVTCMKGKVFDVAVDLRAGAATFRQWFARELTPEGCESMLVPPGFAHGIQALTDEVELLYVHSAPHSPESESGISPMDPLIGIKWPLPVGNLSQRDASFPALSASFRGLDA